MDPLTTQRMFGRSKYRGSKVLLCVCINAHRIASNMRRFENVISHAIFCRLITSKFYSPINNFFFTFVDKVPVLKSRLGAQIFVFSVFGKLKWLNENTRFFQQTMESKAVWPGNRWKRTFFSVTVSHLRWGADFRRMVQNSLHRTAYDSKKIRATWSSQNRFSPSSLKLPWPGSFLSTEHIFQLIACVQNLRGLECYVGRYTRFYCF